MQRQDRKSAIAAYKERKSAAGIYAVRCATADAVWVGQTLTLGSVQNRIWFSLRMGNNTHAAMQKAWRDFGPEEFVFETLEQLPEEELAFARDALLKERLAYWRDALSAQTI